MRLQKRLIRATGWAGAPRWGGRLRCWLAAPLPLPQTSNLGLQCGADRHPSSPFALSGSSDLSVNPPPHAFARVYPPLAAGCYGVWFPRFWVGNRAVF
jgi:hypothetical protein